MVHLEDLTIILLLKMYSLVLLQVKVVTVSTVSKRKSIFIGHNAGLLYDNSQNNTTTNNIVLGYNYLTDQQTHPYGLIPVDVHYILEIINYLLILQYIEKNKSLIYKMNHSETTNRF